MKTIDKPINFLLKRSAVLPISKSIRHKVIKYAGIGILAILTIGVFTSSQEINAG